MANEGYTTFFVTLNVFLSVVALIGNLLILVALRKVTSINPTTKLLFQCLAASDLCVGLIQQPLFVAVLLRDLSSPTASYYVTKVYACLGYILCGVSLMTAATISVDRLLALILGLSYKLTVTVKRVRKVVIIVWLVSFSVGFPHWIDLRFIAYGSSFVVTLFSIFASAFSFTKIVLKLRQQQAQVQQYVEPEQVNGGEIPLNIARYKKMVYTVAWLQMALIVCYIPFISLVFFAILEDSLKNKCLAYQSLSTEEIKGSLSLPGSELCQVLSGSVSGVMLGAFVVLVEHETLQAHTFHQLLYEGGI
ncbi:adenosine receptor A2a-like [Acropora palmata]|uniref:adenosine receptor A2a-like n=1 Tax=Acropora palmata TaxID=6131 RepID=UPI003DA03FC8